MKRISCFTIAFFAFAGVASAVPYKVESLSFAAPIVADHNSLPGDTQFGTIVYDNTSGTFMGLSATGSWQSLTSIQQWSNAGGNLYYSSGNVGIGTATPSFVLDVKNASAYTLAQFENTYTSPDSNSNSFVFFKNNFELAHFGPWQDLGVRIGSREIANGGAGDVYFTSGNDSVFMVGKASGNVGIGTITPTVSLDVAGGIRPGDSDVVTTCGSGQANGEGTQRYNYTSHAMEYCNGTTWVAM